MTTAYGTVVPSNPAPDSSETLFFDHFGVRNSYYLPQVGLASSLRRGTLSLSASGKVGLGVLHQQWNLDGGTTTVSATGTTSQFPGAVLVQATNRGRFGEDRFAVVPELNATAGWDATHWLRLTLGYDFLYLSDAGRASQAIDSVDSRQVPQLKSYDPAAASGRPANRFDHSGLWVQGLAAGFELRY